MSKGNRIRKSRKVPAQLDTVKAVPILVKTATGRLVTRLFRFSRSTLSRSKYNPNTEDRKHYEETIK